MTETPIKIKISEELGIVSGIFTQPENAKYLLILAHGAGADMNHSFMETLTKDLCENDIAVFLNFFQLSVL